jgi:hypothetical protein
MSGIKSNLNSDYYPVRHVIDFTFYSPVPDFVSETEEVTNHAQLTVAFRNEREAEYAQFCRYYIEPSDSIIIEKMFNEGKLYTGMDDELDQHLNGTYFEGKYVSEGTLTDNILTAGPINIPDDLHDIPLDGITVPPPLKTNRLDCTGFSCDVCHKINSVENELFQNGIYTCREENLDICIECSKTKEGLLLMDSYTFTLLDTGKEPYLIFNRNKISRIRIPKNCDPQNITGTVTVYYRRGYKEVYEVINNEKV